MLFFSFITTQDKQKFYFNWKQRKELKFSKDCDSHSYIAKYLQENELHKWEYNPLTQRLIFGMEHKIFEEDESQVLAWCKELDFKTIVEPLIIKPIIDPRKVIKQEWTKEDEENLRKWISVVNSMGISVWDSVRAFVDASTGASKCDYVEDSIQDAVWDSVEDVVRDSMINSERDSIGTPMKTLVWNSVIISIWAYISSFFNISEFKKYRCYVALWERGFVPSFDGTIWRIHQGKDMAVIKEFKF